MALQKLGLRLNKIQLEKLHLDKIKLQSIGFVSPPMPIEQFDLLTQTGFSLRLQNGNNLAIQH